MWSEPDPKCGLDDAIAPFLALHHDFDGRGTKPIRLGAELYFTGHSLGAAVATLALAKTASDGCSASSTSNCEQLRYVPVSGLYTYGSPRPFNRTFANGFARMMQDRTPIMRFVHNSDVVPFVPGSPFSHPGFDGSEADFQILVAPGRTLVGEEVKRFNASTGGADHSILSYLPVLAERLNADSPSP